MDSFPAVADAACPINAIKLAKVADGVAFFTGQRWAPNDLSSCHCRGGRETEKAGPLRPRPRADPGSAGRLGERPIDSRRCNGEARIPALWLPLAAGPFKIQNYCGRPAEIVSVR
jgi:hypothetical protein